MWRQHGRHRTGTTGGNSLNQTQQWMGNITEWSGFDYVEATRKAQDRNYWRQLIESGPAQSGQDLNMWRQQGSHKTGTTGGNSLHLDQRRVVRI